MIAAGIFWHQKTEQEFTAQDNTAERMDIFSFKMEGNVDGINSTRDGIAVSDILPEVTPGRYRLVVFTPCNTHYAEFDVQD